MKKIIFIMAAAALLACFTACSRKNKVSKSEGKIKVVATIFLYMTGQKISVMEATI